MMRHVRACGKTGSSSIVQAWLAVGVPSVVGGGTAGHCLRWHGRKSLVVGFANGAVVGDRLLACGGAGQAVVDEPVNGHEVFHVWDPFRRFFGLGDAGGDGYRLLGDLERHVAENPFVVH